MCWDAHDVMHGKPTGGCVHGLEMDVCFVASHKEIFLRLFSLLVAIRISFGYHNTWEDCDKLILFLKEYLEASSSSFSSPSPGSTLSISHSSPAVSLSPSTLSELAQTSPSKEDTVGTPSQGNMVVDALYVYPIKSCKAYAVPSGTQWEVGVHDDTFTYLLPY